MKNPQSIESIGEFGLIEKIRESFSDIPLNGMTGLGDDCAIISQTAGLDTLVSTDMLVEGVHFLRDDILPRDLGWKSAAVNISDIAAMGGKPVATFLSFALPSGLSQQWVSQFTQGYRDISSQYEVPLLGGDTTSSPDRICINVAILGSCPHGAAKRRSGAKIGDAVCVTGNLGDSAGGLQLILKGLERDEVAERLVRAHYHPIPRVGQGLVLGACEGVHSMMDISDGIASDLRHILKASGAGARICLDKLPISNDLLSFCSRYKGLVPDALELATSGGEDYELLFTASPECLKNLKVEYTIIGEIVEGGPDIEWVGDRRDFMGFRHF